MVNIHKLIDIDKITPIAFHPYTSLVIHALISIEYDSDDYYINELEKDLINLFNAEGIPCSVDNKIVFECEIRGKKMYLGFKDWVFSIGFGAMIIKRG